MQFEGSVITEQGVTFAVIVVKPHVVQNHIEADRFIARAEQAIFSGLPVVLVAESGGRPTWYGRKDISRFMARIPIAAVPWKRDSFSF